MLSFTSLIHVNVDRTNGQFFSHTTILHIRTTLESPNANAKKKKLNHSLVKREYARVYTHICTQCTVLHRESLMYEKT